MRLQHHRKTEVAGFFYGWIVGSSKATFSTILEIERVLYHDLHSFWYSEIGRLPLSELYHLLTTGPSEKQEGDIAAVDEAVAKVGMRLAGRRER